MDISLSGKRALICGSTQGIGLAIAKELATLGAHCVLVARNEESLHAALSSLDNTKGQKHHFLVADFSNPEDLQMVIEAYVKHSPVQVLVNNTGGPKPGPIIEEPEEKFVEAFRMHLVCNQILAKAVLPGMRDAGYGRIINVISTSVRIPISNLGVSNTIRAAVASWAKTWANEVGVYNITVNSILPGYTETQRLESLIETNAAKRGIPAAELADQMRASIPMKRFGKAGEIAAVAAFLASPAASFVNGVSIPVDGGSTGTI